jgi:hypothetical protein
VRGRYLTQQKNTHTYEEHSETWRRRTQGGLRFYLQNASLRIMKWYYTIAGGHTHVQVFMNGGKCGDLVFRNEEFEQVKKHCQWILFIFEGIG